MMCALAPQTRAENVAQSPLRPLSCTLVESISRTQSPIFRRSPACKDLHRTRSIGGRERRSRYRAAAEMVKLAGVTLQARFNLAQTPCAAKLPIQHRDQMGLGLYDTAIPVRLVLIHKPIEGRPR